MDQGGQAGDALEATTVSSVPANEVRLHLSALAYRFGNRRRVLPPGTDT
jgi:hypothetical protein